MNTTHTAATAQFAYLAAAAHISGQVSELQTLADRLHDISPDAINWGHAGDLTHIQAALAEVLSFINNRGD
jgi:hypothetical protein